MGRRLSFLNPMMYCAVLRVSHSLSRSHCQINNNHKRVGCIFRILINISWRFTIGCLFFHSSFCTLPFRFFLLFFFSNLDVASSLLARLVAMRGRSVHRHLPQLSSFVIAICLSDALSPLLPSHRPPFV